MLQRKAAIGIYFPNSLMRESSQYLRNQDPNTQRKMCIYWNQNLHKKEGFCPMRKHPKLCDTRIHGCKNELEAQWDFIQLRVFIREMIHIHTDCCQHDRYGIKNGRNVSALSKWFLSDNLVYCQVGFAMSTPYIFEPFIMELLAYTTSSSRINQQAIFKKISLFKGLFVSKCY